MTCSDGEADDRCRRILALFVKNGLAGSFDIGSGNPALRYALESEPHLRVEVPRPTGPFRIFPSNALTLGGAGWRLRPNAERQ